MEQVSLPPWVELPEGDYSREELMAFDRFVASTGIKRFTRRMVPGEFITEGETRTVSIEGSRYTKKLQSFATREEEEEQVKELRKHGLVPVTIVEELEEGVRNRLIAGMAPLTPGTVDA